MISVTILCENTARGAGVLGEHGLAFWIDTGEHRVLFDTGQGMALEHNARRLGIDLASADAIVVSHGHYDHVGGLEAALRLAPKAVLHLHPRAVEAKFSASSVGGTVRRISLPVMEERRFGPEGREVVVSGVSHEIVPRVWSTGEIARCNDFEDAGGPFYLDEVLSLSDLIADEQSLCVETAEGLVVLSGCAHAGVVNTVTHVGRLFVPTKLRMILGGWHLENASPRRLARTLDALRELPGPELGFCHCTGAAASRRLWAEFPERCVPAHAGARWTFER